MSAAIAPIQPTEAPIFGYAYNSTFFCNGCIEGALCENAYSELHTAEQALDLIADDNIIDRTHEETYSFADFPKILRENNGAYCADCGGPLNKDLRDPQHTPKLCAADHEAGETCRLADGIHEGAHTIVTGATS